MNFELILLYFLPFILGFTITFLLKLDRNKENPNFLRILLWSIFIGMISEIIICSGIALFLIHSFATVVENHYSKPLKVEDARHEHCPIPLPDEARNVQFAFAHGGMQAFETLVRFEAPVKVCRQHAQAVINAYTTQEHEQNYTVYLHKLTFSPPKEGDGMLGANQTSWFDIEKIIHGETNDDASNGPQIWIDEDRGIFYYRLTDWQSVEVNSPPLSPLFANSTRTRNFLVEVTVALGSTATLLSAK